MKKLKLYEIFESMLDHKNEIFKSLINFKTGQDFEINLKSIFDNNSIVYQYQPYGSQNFPDFKLINHDINIECKTSKTGKIVWNSGFPHTNMILIYASSKKNDITFFLGEEIIKNNTLRNKIKEWAKCRGKELKEEFKKFGIKSFNFYLREMYNDETNRLDTPNRNSLEKNVIIFLRKNDI